MSSDGGPSLSEGIYRALFDPADGTLSDLQLAAEVEVSPSWFRWHPVLPVLYTTNETFFGEDSAITAFRLTATTGGLTRLGRLGTNGASCCHLSVSPDGRWIGASNHAPDSDVEDVPAANRHSAQPQSPAHCSPPLVRAHHAELQMIRPVCLHEACPCVQVRQRRIDPAGPNDRGAARAGRPRASPPADRPGHARWPPPRPHPARPLCELVRAAHQFSSCSRAVLV